MNLPKNKRINTDIIRLINNNHIVRVANLNQFTVLFNGPSNTPYKNGVWIISVSVEDDYPFKPPIVKFKTKIFHPNIDRDSGAICINVLHETWSPIYEMLNIFENFLPQLLKYPNPHDPLNVYAAQLILQKPELYEQKVLKYVQKYALEKVGDNTGDEIKNDGDGDGDGHDGQNVYNNSVSSSSSSSDNEMFDECLADMVD